MVRLIFLITLFVNFATVSASQEMSRDEAMDMFYTPNTDVHTCMRVKQLGKGAISEDECKSKLQAANSHCQSFIKKQIPETIDEKTGILLVQIIMSCSISKILEYPYAVKNGKPIISFPK